MKRIFILAILLFTTYSALPQPPKPIGVTVKDTAASNELVKLAKENVADQVSFRTKLDQARNVLAVANQSSNEQIAKLRTALDAKLRQDKKYKDDMDQIDAIQKKIDDSGKDAEKVFQKDMAQIQARLQGDGAKIQTLIDVVRTENNLPPEAVFDIGTQKWTLAAKEQEAKKP